MLEIPIIIFYMMFGFRYFYVQALCTTDMECNNDNPAHTGWLIKVIIMIMCPTIGTGISVLTMVMIYYARSIIRPENQAKSVLVSDINNKEIESYRN